MSILQALATKPIDWVKVESVVRTYPSWEAAVDEYARAVRKPYEDPRGPVARAAALRRALAYAVVAGHPADSISAAARACKSLGKSPIAMLNAHFSGIESYEASATEGAKFVAMPQEQLVEKQAALPPEQRLKTIFPALPVSGQWWKKGTSTFVMLEFNMPINPENINRWFSKYLEEA